MSSTTRDVTRPFVSFAGPVPTNLEARGYYNFFTPNERISEDDGARYLGASVSTLYDAESQEDRTFYTDPDGRLVADKSFRGQVPRYIKVSFTPPSPEEVPRASERESANLLEKYLRGEISTPESIQSPFDISFRIMDLSNANRLRDKFRLATKMTGIVRLDDQGDGVNAVDMFEEPDANSAFESPDFEEHAIGGNRYDIVEEDQVSRHPNHVRPVSYLRALVELDNLDNLLSPNELDTLRPLESNEANFDENIKRLAKIKIRDTQFSSIAGTFNRLRFKKFLDNPKSKNRLISRGLEQEFIDDANERSRLPGRSDESLDDVMLPSTTQEFAGNPDVRPSSAVKLVGYMIERFQTGEFSLGSSPEKVFFVSSPDANNFVDPSVQYGTFYTYSMRSVFRIQHEASPMVNHFAYITSNPTPPVEARVIETTPPAHPDGIRFRFNFKNRKGLTITWQYPVGRQQDTKYFQIFRRKSIDEPFTCIGMIDFDNTIGRSKSPLREKVREDKVKKYKKAVTFFEDPEFKPNDSYIYALASVDAHGLTSGYSTQTRVSFKKTRNELVLKRISQHGAPKQYPNFFVDPDEDENTFVNTLTQDVMLTSGFDRMTIYFDPDGLKYMTNDSPVAEQTPEGAKSIFVVNSPGQRELDPNAGKGVYKMTIMNIDRQKSRTVEISVDDFRGSTALTQ